LKASTRDSHYKLTTKSPPCSAIVVAGLLLCVAAAGGGGANPFLLYALIHPCSIFSLVSSLGLGALVDYRYAMEHNKEKASELRSVSFLLLLLPFPISFLCSREILHIARPTVYDDHRNLLLSICTRISAKPIDDVDEDLLFCFVVLYNSVTMSNQQLLSKLIAFLSTSSSSSPRCFFFF
jgi:hypothetical protein